MKKLFTTRYTDNGLTFALFILRLSLGGLMLPHGFDKLMKFAAMADKFPDPFHVGSTISLSMCIFAEFFCAVFVLVGLMTKLATIPLIISTGVAIYFSHHGRIFGDGEHAALFFAGYLALLFTGPGKISMDRLIGK